MPIRFEWDAEKAASNLAKHRVSFETAMRACCDPFALSAQDRTVHGEERWQTIGRVGECLVLLVAHVVAEDEDGTEVIRIISARKATSGERKRYEQNC